MAFRFLTKLHQDIDDLGSLRRVAVGLARGRVRDTFETSQGEAPQHHEEPDQAPLLRGRVAARRWGSLPGRGLSPVLNGNGPFLLGPMPPVPDLKAGIGVALGHAGNVAYGKILTV